MDTARAPTRPRRSRPSWSGRGAGRAPVIAFVVGTAGDPQDVDAVRARLEKAGAVLAPTSTDAAEWAVSLVTGK